MSSPFRSFNGKPPRERPVELADLANTALQHARVIAAQGERLKAYGERLADALVTIEQLKKDVAGLKAQYARVELEPAELRIQHVTTEPVNG